MKSKVVLSLEGAFIGEYPLTKDQMSIGRGINNDIVIDSKSTSNEHAVIHTISSDSFIEDRNSTNGISVNDMVVKKHFLQDNDLIHLGGHDLLYKKEDQPKTASSEFEKTMMVRAYDPATQATTHNDSHPQKTEVTSSLDKTITKSDKMIAAPQLKSIQAIGMLQVLNGNNFGVEIELTKNLTSIGKPNTQVAVITRRPKGYFLTHVEGDKHPTVCGKSIGNTPYELQDHDVIELVGTKLEFYYK